MTLAQLNYLLEIARAGSFSKAAKTLYLTQPTLSMQVQNLEEELGVKLFDRTKKPLLLTEAGKVVVAQAQVIIRETARMQEIVEELKGHVSGQLRLGILPTIAPYLLPLFVPSFTKRYPEVQLRTEELTTVEILAKLNDDTLDAGIVAGPLDAKGIEEFPLFYEKMFAYVSPNHPWFSRDTICLDRIALQELWLLKEEHCFRSQALQVCGTQLQHNDEHFVFESGSLETLKRLVESYDGLTILPELATLSLSEEQKVLVKPLEKQQPYRQVSLITARHYVKERLIKRLTGELIDSLPDEIRDNQAKKIVPVVIGH